MPELIIDWKIGAVGAGVGTGIGAGNGASGGI